MSNKIEELKTELNNAIDDLNVAYDYYYTCGGMYNRSYYMAAKRRVEILEKEIEDIQKNKENDLNKFEFDERRPISSTIESMMGISIEEYCFGR